MHVSDTEKQQWKSEGYFIPNFTFDPKTIAEVRSEFDRIWTEDTQATQSKGDPKAMEMVRLRPFIAELHKRSEICKRFCQHPIFQTLSNELVGSDTDLYYNQAVIKPPSKGRSFGWHQDNQYGITEPLEYITCWVAISRAIVDNGTIWISPGLHSKGLLPHKWDETSKEWQCQFDDSWKRPVVLQSGQMAIFSSLLPHASGPNVSSETRYAYVIQYHKAGVKKLETGEPWGDQFPLLRKGQFVNA